MPWMTMAAAVEMRYPKPSLWKPQKVSEGQMTPSPSLLGTQARTHIRMSGLCGSGRARHAQAAGGAGHWIRTKGLLQCNLSRQRSSSKAPSAHPPARFLPAPRPRLTHLSNHRTCCCSAVALGGEVGVPSGFSLEMARLATGWPACTGGSEGGRSEMGGWGGRQAGCCAWCEGGARGGGAPPFAAARACVLLPGGACVCAWRSPLRRAPMSSWALPAEAHTSWPSSRFGRAGSRNTPHTHQGWG